MNINELQPGQNVVMINTETLRHLNEALQTFKANAGHMQVKMHKVYAVTGLLDAIEEVFNSLAMAELHT